MEKLKITKVSATDKRKDGTSIVDKFGKPRWRVGLQTTQYGTTWLNGFLGFKPEWEGTEQELDIKDEEYQGKVNKVFSLPKKDSPLISRIEDLEERVTKLESRG